MTDPDRRPWLILSAREGVALRSAAYQLSERKWTPDLERAVLMIDRQLAFIAGDSDQHEPQPASAAERDRCRDRKRR